MSYRTIWDFWICLGRRFWECEKKKDVYNIYENELHPKNVEENEGIKDYTEFDGINDDWEEFNERDTSLKKKA